LQRTIPAYLSFRFVTDFYSPIKGMVTMLLSSFFRFLRQWRAYDTSLRELSRLGDRELADIGISRSEIARVAWENAERTA
jgi:uncharacterized protein YjiS (DUF1127 family)